MQVSLLCKKLGYQKMCIGGFTLYGQPIAVLSLQTKDFEHLYHLPNTFLTPP